MTTPTVSIIIPVYNVADYIAECLQSVKNFADTEIIIVDDASTDNSIAIAKQILPHATYLTHATNKGLSEARNTGIRVATGDYIQFLDSDDWLLTPTEPKGDVTIVDYMTYDGNKLSPRKRQAWNAGWRHIVRRQWLLENDLFFEPGLLLEDVRWVHELHKANPVIHRNHTPTIAYRNQRPDSIMNQQDPQKVAKRLIHLNQTVRRCKSFRTWVLMLLYIKDYNALPELKQSYRGLYPRCLLQPTKLLLTLTRSLISWRKSR